MENRTFSNSSMDGFMRVLNYNPLDGGELNRYMLPRISDQGPSVWVRLS